MSSRIEQPEKNEKRMTVRVMVQATLLQPPKAHWDRRRRLPKNGYYIVAELSTDALQLKEGAFITAVRKALYETLLRPDNKITLYLMNPIPIPGRGAHSALIGVDEDPENIRLSDEHEIDDESPNSTP